MEPLNDKELNQLLRQWEAPRAPATMRLPAGASGHSTLRRLSKWLWSGKIHIPVPVGALAVFAVVAIWIYSNRDATAVSAPPTGNAVATPVSPAIAPASPSATPPAEYSAPSQTESEKAETAALSGFRPVRQLEPRVIRERP